MTIIDAKPLVFKKKSIFQSLSQRKVAINLNRVPLLVIPVVVLTQNLGIIISLSGRSDVGYHGTG